MTDAKVADTRTEDGRSRILAAALDVFAAVGFEGASLRQIAEAAGVMHQLAVYHFKTKDALWRAAINALFDATGQVDRRLERVAGLGPADALRAYVRGLVRFTATQPQFHRILTFEGQADTERFRWLVETYVKPHFELSTRLIREAQAAGCARAGDPARLHYAVIGLVTTRLVFALEYRTVTGVDPFAPDELAATEAEALGFLGLDGA